MVSIGTPFSSAATRVLFCGSGELGKEVVIELQRLGVEVIACDRYENAPAMQVADRSHTFSMLDGDELRRVVEAEKPDLIVPEIEAIATDTLVELESEGFRVIPSARAAQITMNREGIRRLAAEELGLATSPYAFAADRAAFNAAIALLRDRGMEEIIEDVYTKSLRQMDLPKEEVINYVKDIYSPFKPEEISAKISELLTPKDMKAPVEIVFQSIENLHKACPNNLGDWYFTGNYPTPGGNKVVNKAFINWKEDRNERAY